MKNLISTLFLGGALAFNSYSQDTLKNRNGYEVYDKKNQLIKEAEIQNNKKYTWNYEYDNKGKLVDIKGFREVNDNDKLYFDSYIKENGETIEGILKNGPGVRTIKK